MNTKTTNEHQMAKGTLYLMIAQVIFLGSGYLIHFGLARMVSPTEYGRFGIILSILMITQIFLNMGIPEAVSKFISEGRDTGIVKKKALKLQLIFSIILFLLVFLLAPLIAKLLNDLTLSNYIRFVSFIIPIRAIYTVFRGILNGFRRFVKSALVNIINAFFRIFFAFLFIFLGYGLYGAIGGYISGAFIALLFALILTKDNHKGKKISLKDIITFSTPMIGFASCYTIIMNLDILFAKALINNQDMIGYYTAARVLSSIVFAVPIVMSISLLPSISKSYAKKDFNQIRSYINESLRYLVMLLIPIVIIVSLLSSQIISLFFPENYIIASSALSVLSIGVIFISIFVVLGSIINGSGEPKISFSLGLLLLVIGGILNYFLIQKLGILGGAYSTLAVGFIGIFSFSSIVYKKFHALINIKSFLKIIFAGIIITIFIFLIKNFYLIDKYLLIPVSLFSFIIYLLILLVVREIGEYEINFVKRIFIK
jgi:O-antigen/teichoic acid export membrane protein